MLSFYHDNIYIDTLRNRCYSGSGYGRGGRRGQSVGRKRRKSTTEWHEEKNGTEGTDDELVDRISGVSQVGSTGPLGHNSVSLVKR